jgi:hypothetical protein
MNTKVSLNPSLNEKDLDDEGKARYGSAIGALMYLMIGTRPDISFALATLSRFVSRPQSHHQAALQRILRYLKATQMLRITYCKGDLIGYSDADFGGSVVTEGAYSTSGNVFKLAGAPISWSSKKQGKSQHLLLTLNISANTTLSSIFNGSELSFKKPIYINHPSRISWLIISPRSRCQGILNSTNEPSTSM